MAAVLTDSDDSLLRRYARPIAHMRWQHHAKRLGVVFGAGASEDLGFPNWDNLVTRVLESPELDGGCLKKDAKNANKPLPIVAEVAYRAFRERHINEALALSSNTNDVERLVTARWIDLIHQCLYRDVPADPADLLKRDTVYQHFLPVVRESPMTINYNYDDSLQRLLLYTRPSLDLGRGFETVTDPNLQHSPANGVLYHPNGFLPRNHLERTTDKLVFNDGTYAGQMVDFMMGVFSALLHNLSTQTWLLIGLSLGDETLRHLLHQSALLNPGHYHYHVEHCQSHVETLTDAMRWQFAANFETYNLITLFLDSEAIAALGHCLGVEADDLRARAEEKQVRMSYTYYLTGVPGVGKSTALAHLKDLATWDEWLDERLPEMSKKFVDLTDDERERVDKWVLAQIGEKNRRLLDAERNNGIGITLVDRCVPDAVTFGQPDQWGEKADAIIKAVSSGAPNRHVHPGHVILLVGDAREIKIRAATKNKDTSEKYTLGMQMALKAVYGDSGVTELNATNMTVAQVVKEIARIIHLNGYQDCNLQKRLEDIRDERVDKSPPIEEE